ncbi:hypothetical protein [Mesorhizobium sp. Mes31]|nr:hypothetical protein [Mesorhizobium sp. Mes31]
MRQGFGGVKAGPRRAPLRQSISLGWVLSGRSLWWALAEVYAIGVFGYV